MSIGASSFIHSFRSFISVIQTFVFDVNALIQLNLFLAMTEHFVTRNTRRMGAMRKKTQGYPRMDRQNQWHARLNTIQKEAVT